MKLERTINISTQFLGLSKEVVTINSKIKKAIPILIIIILVGMKIYSIKLDKRQEEIAKNNIPVEDYDISAMHEGIGDGVKEEYQSGYEVINIDKCQKFLDPFETYRYNDLLLLYSNYILSIADISTDNKTFFIENERMLKDIMGIYSLEDLNILSEKISKANVSRKSVLKDIEILDIVQEGNLLKSKINITYSETNLEIEHYLSYVYIENISNLYIYDIN